VEERDGERKCVKALEDLIKSPSPLPHCRLVRERIRLFRNKSIEGRMGVEGSERGPVERGKRLRRLKVLTEWWR
jgi:hypothetical protein